MWYWSHVFLILGVSCWKRERKTELEDREVRSDRERKERVGNESGESSSPGEREQENGSQGGSW